MLHVHISFQDGTMWEVYWSSSLEVKSVGGLLKLEHGIVEVTIGDLNSTQEVFSTGLGGMYFKWGIGAMEVKGINACC